MTKEEELIERVWDASLKMHQARLNKNDEEFWRRFRLLHNLCGALSLEHGRLWAAKIMGQKAEEDEPEPPQTPNNGHHNLGQREVVETKREPQGPAQAKRRVKLRRTKPTVAI